MTQSIKEERDINIKITILGLPSFVCNVVTYDIKICMKIAFPFSLPPYSFPYLFILQNIFISQNNSFLFFKVKNSSKNLKQLNLTCQDKTSHMTKYTPKTNVNIINSHQIHEPQAS